MSVSGRVPVKDIHDYISIFMPDSVAIR